MGKPESAERGWSQLRSIASPAETGGQKFQEGVIQVELGEVQELCESFWEPGGLSVGGHSIQSLSTSNSQQERAGDVLG